jgi:hypothetical protein
MHSNVLKRMFCFAINVVVGKVSTSSLKNVWLSPLPLQNQDWKGLDWKGLDWKGLRNQPPRPRPFLDLQQQFLSRQQFQPRR